MPKRRAAAAVLTPPSAAGPMDRAGTPHALPRMAYEAFGERRLMLAVLEDAIRTLLLAKRSAISRKRLLRELEWMESRSHAEPFAFESICAVLGIDPGYLRRRLTSGAFVPARGPRARGPRTGIRRAIDAGPGTCSASF